MRAALITISTSKATRQSDAERDRYEEFCARHLAYLDELVLEWFGSGDFDALLDETVRSVFPAHEHEEMIARHRGLVGAWVKDNGIE